MVPAETATRINEAEAGEWLSGYKTAWETRDVALALTLFSPDADYRERRFGPPLLGHETLASYWRDRVFEHQRDIQFDFQIWAVRQNMCVAGWQARFEWIPINGFMEIDGVCRLQFMRSESGGLLCYRFEEWMDQRELR